MTSHAELLERLSYDHDTGVFVWLKNTGFNNPYAGRKAGYIGNRGYVKIEFNQNYYLAHRLAWFYHYGKWPSGQIDHINHNVSDNRISNLRDVPQTGNMQNQIKAQNNNKTGLLGVTWNKSTKKWRATIMTCGKKEHVGYFNDKNEAHNAYLQAKRIYHSTCII